MYPAKEISFKGKVPDWPSKKIIKSNQIFYVTSNGVIQVKLF